MTREEGVNWLINIMADIGKAEHRDLWHYEQALMEIREMLESQPGIIRCKDCKWSDWYTAAADGKRYCYCMETGASGRTEDDFCSYAERKEGDE